MNAISNFFGTEEAKEAIEQISSASNLTIYAGAGVSLDRTGMSWKTLSENLLLKVLDDKESVDAISKLGDSGYVSSLAAQLFEKKGEQELPGTPDIQASQKTDHLIRSLRECLYSQPSMARGRLIETIAEFVVARVNLNLKTTIITTNYDTYLEDSLRQVLNEGDLEQNKSALHSHGKITIVDDLLVFRYIHGRVPTERSSLIVEPIVLSERDYAETRERSFKIIRKRLQKSDFLFVGASIRDAPLIEALLSFRKSHRDKYGTSIGDPIQLPHKRWALVRDPSLRLKKSRIGTSVRHANNVRLEALGISPLEFSFNFEVSQFFSEMVTRIAPSPVEKDEAESASYENPPSIELQPFDERMKSWSKHLHIFTESLASDIVDRTQQHEAHNALTEAVVDLKASIRKELNLLEGGTSLDFKMELWIIDLTQSPNTVLRLAASSDAIWVHADGSRSRPIFETDNDYASSLAFRNGATAVLDIDDDDTRSRWRTHIGVPVRSYSYNLPVGSVVVSITGNIVGPDFLERIVKQTLADRLQNWIDCGILLIPIIEAQ